VKRVLLWIFLGVYGLLSLAPTLYIHGCCCGVVEQWMIPPDECCKLEHVHQHSVQLDCCNEEIVSFHLSANQLPSFFQFNIFCGQLNTIATPWFKEVAIVTGHSEFNKTENPPPLLRRFIQFQSLKIFDVIHGITC
jgi:hypothetical protein